MSENAKKSGASLKQSPIYEVYEFLESILSALAMVVVVLLLTVRPTVVNGSSMLPTLHHGEYLLVSGTFYTPQYNDIIVLQAKDLINEEGTLGKPIVKRVIGLPGDTIFVDKSAGYIYRNDEKLEVEEIDGILYEDGHMINDYTLSGHLTGSVTVPENSVFVCGDNRNDSKDSRFADVGMVDDNYIVGKVVLRFFPFDVFGKIES